MIGLYDWYLVDVNCPACEAGKVTILMGTGHPDDPIEPRKIEDGTCMCSDPENKYIKKDLYWDKVSSDAAEKERIYD